MSSQEKTFTFLRMLKYGYAKSTTVLQIPESRSGGESLFGDEMTVEESEISLVNYGNYRVNFVEGQTLTLTETQ